MVVAAFIRGFASSLPSSTFGARVRGCAGSGEARFQHRDGRNGTTGLCGEPADESDSVRVHESDTEYTAVGEGLLQRHRHAVVNGDELSGPHVSMAMLERES